MWHKIVGASLIALLAGGPTGVAESTSAFLVAEDMQFLEELTEAVVEASRVPVDGKVGEIGPNVTGGVVIRPGGRACYPAFWIRDYALSLECGRITPEEQRHALLLTAKHQRDTAWQLPNGSVVPVGAIADHISFGNKPIFYPGTLEDYEGQGGPKWGRLPCLDDHYFFIHMAAAYIANIDRSAILLELVNGRSLLARLDQAFDVPPSRPGTGLVYADENNRGVSFGFMDTVTHTGDLLFCSLLKYRAALEMVWMHEKLKELDKVRRYRDIVGALRQSIPEAFSMETGLLRASTGKSAQPDVWGTAFAVYIRALKPEPERAACNALATAYKEGALAWRGNIRHVPTTGDFSDTTAWEAALPAKNRYQNGAYWGTPTGWVCYAIAKVDLELARQLAREYIAELREGDFRKGDEFGAPWECMHSDGDHRQNPVYMTSVTCPVAAFRRIERERRAGTLAAPSAPGDSGDAAPRQAHLGNLTAWDIVDYQGRAEVRFEDGSAVLDKGNDMTGIVWKGPLPVRKNYEITLDAMRTDGGDFFCGLTFPYGEDPCSLIVGGWGGTLVGLSCLDYNDAYNNETARFMEFENGRWYRIRVRATDAKIEAWIDDEQLVDVPTKDRIITVRWEMEKCRPLGIATWRTTGAIRNFRMWPLDDTSVAPE